MFESVESVEISGIAAAPLCVYYIGHEKCKPCHSFGPAERNHHLLHFVAAGTGRLQNVNGTFEIKAGNAFYISPGETTVYGTTRTNPWEYYWIGFGGSDAASLLDSIGISSAHPVANCDIDVIRTLIEQMETYRSFVTHDRLMLTGKLYEILSNLSMRNTAPGKAVKSDDYVIKALEFMRETAYYPITVDQVAQYVGLNRSYLFRLVQAQTGQSLKEHLLSFRIERAKELLCRTNYGINRIAAACGFNDANHFGKMFARRTGTTPTQYRKTHSQ